MTGEQTFPDREIFQRAVAIPPHERGKFLDQACGNNAELRRDVESLLQAHDTAGSFLESPAVPISPPHFGEGPATIAQAPIAEAPGTVIGPYKLLQQIGEGGMGVVFMAEQTHPVQRTVALKIIKPGMDTRQVIARFEAERQALAMMDHPNIARVLDAGTTASEKGDGSLLLERPDGSFAQKTPVPFFGGRPYFVMDLVKGIPITDYCDQNRLTVSQRLALFTQVCHAVQHAHQKGIIHRDLKPSNVLVAEYDGKPVPKVIDFGVAKATAQRLTERTMFTQYGQIVGTFEYMSPEQARFNQLDVDTRSDIYSLGVLLYELLIGEMPFDKQRIHSSPFDETLRMIREEEPPRPSTKLGASDTLPMIAANRHTEPARLNKDLRGELDWIVMKALEKERERRYETAIALAADIQHYLDDEPVSAAAPSRAYRVRKFVRRNKVVVIASAAVVAALITGIIGMAIGLVSQSQRRAIAERERAEAQLNYAASLQSQAKYAAAEVLFRRELESNLGARPQDRQRAARTRLQLARMAYDRGNPAESERLHRDALAAYRADFPPGDPNIAQALGDLAGILQAQKRFAEAEPLIREAHEIHRRAVPIDHFMIATSGTLLGDVLITLGRHAEAEPILRAAVAEHQRVVPPDEWALALTRTVLGRALIMADKFNEAEAQLIQAERTLNSTQALRDGYLALAGLYTAWNQAEPGKGYDAKAGEWFRKAIDDYLRPLPVVPHAE